MLTEDEIFLAIDNVPITQKYVVGVGRAIERAALAKADARMHEQNAGSVQPYVQAGAPGETDAERAAWLADKIGAHGDYAKEAAAMLRRWPSAPSDDEIRKVWNRTQHPIATVRAFLPDGVKVCGCLSVANCHSPGTAQCGNVASGVTAPGEGKR